MSDSRLRDAARAVAILVRTVGAEAAAAEIRRGLSADEAELLGRSLRCTVGRERRDKRHAEIRVSPSRSARTHPLPGDELQDLWRASCLRIVESVSDDWARIRWRSASTDRSYECSIETWRRWADMGGIYVCALEGRQTECSICSEMGQYGGCTTCQGTRVVPVPLSGPETITGLATSPTASTPTRTVGTLL